MSGDDVFNTVEDYFQYKPSLALNIIALTLFLGITVVISIQNAQLKSRFMWIVSFTGCLEVAGYVSHLIATETVNDQAYVSFLVFTILAPKCVRSVRLILNRVAGILAVMSLTIALQLKP